MKPIHTYHTTAFTISATTFNIHPKSNLILEAAKKKSKELGIYSEAFYSSHHTMTPYIFTNTDVERSILVTVWFSTLYYLDDFFGEDMQYENTLPDFQSLFNCWITGENNINDLTDEFIPLFEAVAYCGKTIRTNSNEVFFKRYTSDLYQHMLHTLQPVDYKTVTEYIESRIYFGGMYPTMGMIEYVNDVYLYPLFFERCAALKEVMGDCALVGVLSNDLISYHKEKHSDHNLLNAYLKTNLASDLDEAIQMGITHVNQSYESFLANCDLVQKQIADFSVDDKCAITTYLEGLNKLNAASYHWQMSTHRYRSPDNIFEDLRHPV